MNTDYFFLENFYLLIEEGYSLEEALTICEKIYPHKEIRFLLDCLKEGYSIDEAFQQSHLPPTFKEYYSFYSKKNILSKSIENSLKICKMQNSYLNNLRKQLSYPLLLLCFLFFFSLFVVFILMPQVNQLFISFGIERGSLLNIIMTIFQIIPIIFVVIIIVIVLLSIQLYNALKKKKYKIIEFYLDKPIIKTVLQKYFSLKFALYYNELLLEKMDSITIIHILNQQLMNSDLKIVLYEIEERMMEGELIESILEDFIYFDDLFLTFFRMLLEHQKEELNLNNYIDITTQTFELTLNRLMKILTMGIYLFVAMFVIMVYISIIIPMMNIISEI